MANPLDIRLPDLPTDGYATRREKELTDAIMFLLRGIERQRGFLLEVLCDGRDKWRKLFKTAYKAIRADDEAADAVFGYLILLGGVPYRLHMKQLSRSAFDHAWKTMIPHWMREREELERIAKWTPYQRTGLQPGGPTDPPESVMRDLIARVSARNRGNLDVKLKD